MGKPQGLLPEHCTPDSLVTVLCVVRSYARWAKSRTNLFVRQRALRNRPANRSEVGKDRHADSIGHVQLALESKAGQQIPRQPTDSKIEEIANRINFG